MYSQEVTNMNPQAVQQVQQMQPQQGQDLHGVYSGLHQLLLKLHQMGIPGMDQVLGSLVKVHTQNTAPQMPGAAGRAGMAGAAAGGVPQRMAQPTMPQQQGAMPAAQSAGGYYNQLQQVQSMMPGAMGAAGQTAQQVMPQAKGRF